MNAEFTRRVGADDENVYIQLRSRFSQLDSENVAYVDYHVEKHLKQLDLRVENLALTGSGWNLKKILEITVESVEIRSICNV